MNRAVIGAKRRAARQAQDLCHFRERQARPVVQQYDLLLPRRQQRQCLLKRQAVGRIAFDRLGQRGRQTAFAQPQAQGLAAQDRKKPRVGVVNLAQPRTLLQHGDQQFLHGVLGLAGIGGHHAGVVVQRLPALAQDRLQVDVPVRRLGESLFQWLHAPPRCLSYLQ